VLLFIRLIRTKNRIFGILSFCIVWTCLFFLPNWIAEPRAAMTSQHHYQYLSAIGYVGLVAYGISSLKNKYLIAFAGAAFVILNMYKTNELFSLQLPYRSSARIEESMRVVLSGAPEKQTNVLFLFTGDVFWFENSFYWDLGPHFLLRTGDSEKSHMPEVTTDERVVVDRLCASTEKFSRLPVSHLYVWKVLSPGNLLDTTEYMRDKFVFLAKARGCSVLP
jgi:hypothetical protein